MSLREVCHCGHAKDTHFEKEHACLGVLCDCQEYASDLEPKPVVPPPAPSTEPLDEDPFFDHGLITPLLPGWPRGWP